MKAQLLMLIFAASASLAMASSISPWTSPKIDGRSVSCWGRTYRFGDSVLPSAIVTQGQDLLAGPIQLSATVGGKQVRWNRATFKALDGNTESVRYATRATSATLSVECLLTTEFDGVTRVELKVEPEGRVHLDSLDLVVPLKTEHIQLWHHFPFIFTDFSWDWPKKRINSGAITSAGLKMPFTYELWLGDDRRGLQFVSESDEAWSPTDPASAITVTSSGKVTTLRMNLLSNHELTREWSWNFGFVASPVKPYLNKHYSSIHYCQSGTYGEEKLPADGKPNQLEAVLKKMGVTHVGFHENWSDEQSLPRPKNPEELHSLVKGCHDLGMGLVLYTGSWMSTRSPEFNHDWRSKPIDNYMVYERGDNHDKCYYMCPDTGFPDLQVKLFDQAFKDYGFDGLYLDGPATSLPCSNMGHGCGYKGKDGKVHETMPIWKPREIMKQLWRMVRSQPKPGIIVAHTSASITLPILSFADTYLDGEHLLGQIKLGTEEYPEGLMRAEMSGHNFGIPATQLPLREGTEADQERARTVCLLHDALMEWSPQVTADIWRAFDSFGMDKVEWQTCQETTSLIACDSPDVKISSYLDKGRGALFVVANLGDKATSAELTIKRSGLGLKPSASLSARDEAAGTDLPIAQDKLTVDVPPGSFRLVSVQRKK